VIIIFGVSILSVLLVITLILFVLNSNFLLFPTLNVCDVDATNSVVLKLFIVKLLVVPVTRLTNSVVSSFTDNDLVLNIVLPLTIRPSVLFTVMTAFVVLFTFDIVNTSVYTVDVPLLTYVLNVSVFVLILTVDVLTFIVLFVVSIVRILLPPVV